MLKIVSWVDQNSLAFLAGFLLIFIPLYPKWPLFDVLPGYNVRVRLEDFFVLFVGAVYLLQLIRRKVNFSLKHPVMLGLLSYLFMGLISVLVAVFVIQTVPTEYFFVQKTVLHWVRRIEYFSLFFILFGSINSPRKAKALTVVFFLTLIAVTIYGYGQKYLYWPAFSTMNREYAKGWWLYLTEHARVLSTFGGHYDLAGYLVIALSLSWSFFFGAKRVWQKIMVGLVLAGGFWLLILTASRISFASYLVGLAVVVFLWTFKRGFVWGVKWGFLSIFFSIFVMLSFGDLSDRFLHLMRLDQRIGNLKQIVLKPIGNQPRNKAVFLENNLAAVTSKTDMPPLPRDVINNQPLLIEQKTASGASIFVEKQREYSKNATLYDLSTAIRLDATWPRAIDGFKADPLFGKGYATLTQASKYEFTEGESTDSDYLRALGETGLAGFITFFGTLLLMAYISFKSLGGIKDSFFYSLTAGFIGVIIGLMANASYIDIFEASKVAYIFWGVAGLSMGSQYLLRDKIKNDQGPFKLIIPWKEMLQGARKALSQDRFWVLMLVILSLMLRSYKLDAPVADWHSWRQADTSSVTRNFIKNDRIDFFYPTYDDLSSVASGIPNPKGLRMVEFPFYNAASVITRVIFPEFSTESAGRATSAFASGLSLVFIFLICRKVFSRRGAYLAALVFAVLPYNIFYNRTILPDTTMVALALGAVWFSLQYLESGRKRYYLISLLLAIFGLLVKPYAIFLIMPVGYLWVKKYGLDIRKLIQLVLWGLLAAMPLLLWRLWISQFPEGVPASDWLYNGNGIRFKGAFWYWLFADRIGRLITGYWGLVLVAVGLFRKNAGKYGMFPLILFSSSLLYLFIFATGNVQHDYYQILLVPSIAILAGIGLDLLLFENVSLFHGFITKLFAISSFLFMVGFGWYFIRDYYNINHPEIVEAGRAVDRIAPRKSLVVAPYMGDTAFLYQTNRSGWPILEKPIDDMVKMGADFYVSTTMGDLERMMLANSETPENIKKFPKAARKKYIFREQTDKYIIFQLKHNDDLAKD